MIDSGISSPSSAPAFALGAASRPTTVARAMAVGALRSTGNAQPELDQAQVRSAASELKQVIEATSGRQINFKVDDDSQVLTVQVTDARTGRLLRQIPSEEVLKLRERLHELVGMIFDKQA